MGEHYSEVLRIIEGGLRGDCEKVKNYALLLADKVEADGNLSTATRIRRLVEKKSGVFIIPMESIKDL